MKVVILAGGFGSRIAEESHLRPKPMIEIGGKPILWHIMKGYLQAGYDDFIVCAGYRQANIKAYFNDYLLHRGNATFDFRTGECSVEADRTSIEPWRVMVADTGLSTMTAGRLARIKDYVGNEPFMLTYGDGVSDVNPNDVLRFHQRAGGMVTLTGVVLDQRFGMLDVGEHGVVRSFREKHAGDAPLINGGFMVCEPELFYHLGSDGGSADDEDFSSVTLERLALLGELTCYRHDGFWLCMDTTRDKLRLEELWARDAAPWKTWD